MYSLLPPLFPPLYPQMASSINVFLSLQTAWLLPPSHLAPDLPLPLSSRLLLCVYQDVDERLPSFG